MGYVITFFVGVFIGGIVAFSNFAMAKVSSNSEKIQEAYIYELEKRKKMSSEKNTKDKEDKNDMYET